MAKKFTPAEEKRQEYFKKVINFLEQEGEEVLIVGTNELAFPCVDKDGEGIFLTVKVIYPHGGKDGPYDGYDMRDAWNFKLKQDEEKAKAAAIKKQKKIEQDKKKREMSAKIKAEMKKQSAK